MNDGFARRDKLAMGRTYGVPAIVPAAGSVPSVVILEKEQPMAGTKADRDGVYERNGARFRIFKGDPLPDGAVMADEPATAPKATKAPKENAKATGPTETADSAGPSEKA